MWVLTGMIFFSLLAVSETLWRRIGHLPSVKDSKTLWSIHRNRVYSRNNKNTIVVIGTSRAQLGIEPEILKGEFPDSTIIHLALNGTPPYEILKDLCLDPKFKGLILCETTAGYIMPNAVMSKETEFRAKEYVSFYHNEFRNNVAFSEMWDTWIEVYLQDKLVILSPRLNLNSLLENNLDVPPTYIHLRSDRFSPAFYSRMTELRRIRHQERGIRRRASRRASGQTSISKVVFLNNINNELRGRYRALLNRGGELIFVRLPTSGVTWREEEEDIPKKEYWDKITPASGVPTIHFKDYHELSHFTCPDTSHLDATDASNFSHELSKIVKIILEKP